MIANLNKVAVELIRIGPDLRDAAAALLQQLKSGRPAIRIEASEMVQQIERFDRIANRATVGLTLTGMTIGSAIAISAARLNERGLVRRLGTASFVFSLLASGGVVGQALWDSWKRRR